MSRDKAEFQMPKSKAMETIKKNIQNQKNDSSKSNSNRVYALIETREEDKLMAWIEDVGVKGFENIEKLEKKVEELRKPDIKAGNILNGGMDFTRQPDTFSDDRVQELTATHKLLGELIQAYDTAMEKGTEANWKVVEAVNKKVK